MTEESISYCMDFHALNQALTEKGDINMKEKENLIEGTLIAQNLLVLPETEPLFTSVGCKDYFGEVIGRFNFTNKQRYMLMTLFKISQGRIVFTTTRREIVENMYPDDKSKYANLSERAGDGLEFLQKRQEKIRNTFVKIINSSGLGERNRGSLKPEQITFRFEVLGKLKNFILENPENNNSIDSLEGFVDKLKGENVKSLEEELMYI